MNEEIRALSSKLMDLWLKRDPDLLRVLERLGMKPKKSFEIITQGLFYKMFEGDK